MVHVRGNKDQIIPEQKGTSLRPRQERALNCTFQHRAGWCCFRHVVAVPRLGKAGSRILPQLPAQEPGGGVARSARLPARPGWQ